MTKENKLSFDITVTMGPACCTPSVIEELIQAGATSFRFPFSKETPEWQIDKAMNVAEIANKLSLHKVDLIMDLPGSQPRTLNNQPIQLETGQKIIFIITDADNLEDKYLKLKVSNSEKLLLVKKNDLILLGDGEISLCVKTTSDTHIISTVINSGVLERRRGLTVPGNSFICNSISSQDKEFLKYCLKQNFDRILISFINSACEVDDIKKYLNFLFQGTFKPVPKISGKIETFEAIKNIDKIVNSLDYVLVGRGDLLLQVGVLDFYNAQNVAISAAQKIGKPVQVGTQILESVGKQELPHRSEISDLSNLIARQINGVLLSAETTIGARPVQTVRMINQLFQRYGVKP